MRDSRYHGGFDHPVRAFLIGVTLLVLLFGGFVIGTEAGTHPIEQVGATERVVTMTGSTKTVAASVPQKVIEGQVRVIRLPGSIEKQVVVIHRDGKMFYAAIQPAPGASSGVTDSGASFFVVPPTVTVTTPPETVTLPPETVTVTETEPPPSSTDSSGTTQTGP